MTGIYEASKKRGFTDCSTEMFYVDYIEPGQPKKAPFVLRTDDQLSMFFKSESKSILLRVIQHLVQFEKGSVNILLEKDEKLKFRAMILLVYYYILRLKCEWEF